ncbi:MAG: hypothetical protein INQ03_13560 [Candidatus Heimdallarchaeota archaeon]|nr:hypothetical protein [Candidatus Heimdallarchaeota archaeon]
MSQDYDPGSLLLGAVITFGMGLVAFFLDLVVNNIWDWVETILNIFGGIMIVTGLGLMGGAYGEYRAVWKKEKEAQLERERQAAMKIDHDTFERVMMRYSEIELDELARILETNELFLQQWLIKLPKDFTGIKVQGKKLIINNDEIGDHIDQLFDIFEEAEKSGRGKLE